MRKRGDRESNVIEQKRVKPGHELNCVVSADSPLTGLFCLVFGLIFVQGAIVNDDRFSLSYLFSGLHQNLYTRESASCRQTSLPAHKEILHSHSSTLNMLSFAQFSKVWPCSRQISSHTFLHVFSCFFPTRSPRTSPHTSKSLYKPSTDYIYICNPGPHNQS